MPRQVVLQHVQQPRHCAEGQLLQYKGCSRPVSCWALAGHLGLSALLELVLSVSVLPQGESSKALNSEGSASPFREGSSLQSALQSVLQAHLDVHTLTGGQSGCWTSSSSRETWKERRDSRCLHSWTAPPPSLHLPRSTSLNSLWRPFSSRQANNLVPRSLQPGHMRPAYAVACSATIQF